MFEVEKINKIVPIPFRFEIEFSLGIIRIRITLI